MLYFCYTEMVMLEKLSNQIVLRMESIADMILRWMNDHLLNIVVILVVAWIAKKLITVFASNLIKAAVRPDSQPTRADRDKRVQTLYSLAVGVIRLITYIVVVILIISELSPGSLGVILTSAGLLGLAVGIGAQSLVKDVASGIFIIIENQYRIGDQVSLSIIGLEPIEGIVENINIRTTVLRDLSGTAHHLPNGTISLTSNKTLGFSRMSEELVVAMDTNMDKLAKVIQQVGDELAAIPELKNRIVDPPHLANIQGFKDGGVLVRVSAKTKPAEQWKIRSEFYKHLRQAFEKNHIKLTGPQSKS